MSGTILAAGRIGNHESEASMGGGSDRVGGDTAAHCISRKTFLWLLYGAQTRHHGWSRLLAGGPPRALSYWKSLQVGGPSRLLLAEWGVLFVLRKILLERTTTIGYLRVRFQPTYVPFSTSE